MHYNYHSSLPQYNGQLRPREFSYTVNTDSNTLIKKYPNHSDNTLLNGYNQQSHSSNFHINIYKLANAFYHYLVTQFNPSLLKHLLQGVHLKGVFPHFSKALSHIGSQNGTPIYSPQDLVELKYSKDIISKPFKQAERKELNDYVTHGKNTYSASNWEYRLLGMYTSLKSFVDMCKQYPLMSAGVISASAYLGHKYMFFGAISGIGIIAWGLGASVIHEWKAQQAKSRPHEKAHHLIESGENIAAALITSIGVKGIKSGAINGFERGKETAALAAKNGITSKWRQLWRGAKSACLARMKEEHKTTPIEKVLFVTGLFDNVLLPFNWAAQKLQKNPHQPLH